MGTTLRISALDGLRGVAAVGVVLGHARLVYLQNHPHDWVTLPGVRHALDLLGIWGSSAVWLFFVLSGFVLALSFQKAQDIDYGTYVLRRLARLYLPVWGAVVLAIASMLVVTRDVEGLGPWVSAHPTQLSPWGVIQDLTLISGTGSNVTPLWSLRWEILFSLILIVYIAVARRINAFWLIGVSIALCTTGGIYQNALLLYLPMFGIGVGFASAWATFERLASNLRDRVPTPLRAISVGLGLLVIAASQAAPSLMDRVGIASPTLTAAMTTATRIVSVSLIVLIVGTSRSARRVFTSRVVLWLGTISFSLYLVHETVMLAGIYPTRAHPAALVLAVALCFPVAWLFYRLVEAPAHRISKRIGYRTQIAQATP